ncbi:MAG: hypothetical protein JKY67_16580 [Pseudomonadales bacterium]|nr:hypothetical protein [Pseudomonadales bacterium]
MKTLNFLAVVATATLMVGCSTATITDESMSMSKSKSNPAEEMATASMTEEGMDPSSVSETDAEQMAGMNDSAITEPVAHQSISDVEYTCEHSDAKRIIRVINDTATGLACEVSYEKPSGTKTLWTAMNDKGYCADKAAEFAVKQVNWGWHCVNKDGVTVSAGIEN